MKNVKCFCLILCSIMAFSPLNLMAKTSLHGISKIIKNNKLIIALYYKDVFPFYFHDKEGNLTGYDIDIAKNIAKKLGVKPEFNRDARTFDGIINLVARGEADIAISLISITLKRAEKVLFTNPYLILHPVIILNRLHTNNFKYRTGEPIPGIVAVKKGTSYVNFSKIIFRNPAIKEYGTWDEATIDLLENKTFAILRDEVGVNNLFMSDPSLSIKLKIITLKKFHDNIAIATNKDNQHLHYWLDLFLETCKPEQDVKKIIVQYKDLLASQKNKKAF